MTDERELVIKALNGYRLNADEGWRVLREFDRRDKAISNANLEIARLRGVVRSLAFSAAADASNSVEVYESMLRNAGVE